MKITLWFPTVLTIIACAGCAGSYQARSAEVKNARLVNASLLEEGKDGQALYRYVNPSANIKDYSAVIVDPVLIMTDGELSKDDRENYQNLANNAFLYLTQELSKDYKVATAPEPGAMRVQMAIVDADTSKPVRNTLSTFVPVGMVLSWIKYSAVGKQSGVGEITAEMKVTDASTGQLLAAALDRRVGGKELSTLWSSWANADAALKYWAQQSAYGLCTQRGGSNCVKPEN